MATIEEIGMFTTKQLKAMGFLPSRQKELLQKRAIRLAEQLREIMANLKEIPDNRPPTLTSAEYNALPLQFQKQYTLDEQILKSFDVTVYNLKEKQ